MSLCFSCIASSKAVLDRTLTRSGSAPRSTSCWATATLKTHNVSNLYSISETMLKPNVPSDLFFCVSDQTAIPEFTFPLRVAVMSGPQPVVFWEKLTSEPHSNSRRTVASWPCWDATVRAVMSINSLMLPTSGQPSEPPKPAALWGGMELEGRGAIIKTSCY